MKYIIADLPECVSAKINFEGLGVIKAKTMDPSRYKLLLFAALWLSLLVFIDPLNAQSPEWKWAKSSGGTNHDEGQGVCTDVNGNVFVTGYFNDPSVTFGSTILHNAGSQDILLVKYDATGNVRWARSAGGLLDDAGCSVSTDAAGNVYMAGNFESPTITFDGITLSNSGACADIFIVKYNPNGQVIWAKSEGDTECDLCKGVSSDSAGNVFMTGGFDGSIITFGTTTLVNAGLRDVFLVKYDPVGNVLWARSAGGNDEDLANGVATDLLGNVFVTGDFHGPSIDFGSSVLTSQASVSVFLAKYDSNGTVLWVKSASGTTSDVSLGVSTDKSGNATITGYFFSPVITFDTIALSLVGGDDVFVAKYDANGTVQWAKSAGGSQYDAGYSVATDSGGNTYITGHFNSPVMDFGSTDLIPAGDQDIFLLKYDSGGNLVWAKSAGGANYEIGRCIWADSYGNLVLAGNFKSAFITFGATTINNAGFSNLYIAKLGLPSGDPVVPTDDSWFVIAPNPFINQTVINFRNEQFNSIIKLNDIHGRELKNTALNGFQYVLERGHLAAGIYFIQVTDVMGIVTCKRIVIQ